jgi:ribosomal protein S18 acetylase RimI-like enzyme
MTVPLRAIEDDDLDRVVELSLAAWAPIFTSFRELLGDQLYFLAYPDWRESQSRAVRSICSDPEAECWVAVPNGHAVGFVAFRVRLDREPLAGEIEMIAVDPAHQRQGVATRLLEFALDRLHAAGVSVVELATGGDAAHAPARRLYEQAGFRPLPLARYYRRP